MNSKDKYVKKARTRAGLCLLACSFFSLTALPAFGQQDMQARLNRLENEIQTLSRAVFKGEAPPPGAFSSGVSQSQENQAQLDLRLSQLEMDMRALTGRVEEMAFKMRQLEQMLAEQETAGVPKIGVPAIRESEGPAMASPQAEGPQDWLGDSDDAVISEATGGDQQEQEAQEFPVGKLGTLKQSPEGEFTAVDENAGPEDLYAQGFSLLRDRSYEAAETVFSRFLEKYPDHNLASNAKYWLGETYYVRNDYERAARIFAEAYQKYPEGSKGPDNLLKLALSLAGLGKKKDACLALSQLKKQYPDSGPIIVRAENEAKKLECS